ncbi:hypothetical protein BBK36DRAFT_1140097 [Trichoderma citrinoviride]|uniref:Uncharacterized protein n=1 Tax=Trichoderma citrinoviride TaxID=58853 RepID=A0A2T4BDP0_9HYPO|nr:hypothetical protein BBK36DRAFT_1140097 [Trichoderma citrinoviride]PTB67447.1 hypothetical protein BBK36DRAFT_1140097 [Trichoderma citrinoviride]
MLAGGSHVSSPWIAFRRSLSSTLFLMLAGDDGKPLENGEQLSQRLALHYIDWITYHTATAVICGGGMVPNGRLYGIRSYACTVLSLDKIEGLAVISMRALDEILPYAKIRLICMKRVELADHITTTWYPLEPLNNLESFDCDGLEMRSLSAALWLHLLRLLALRARSRLPYGVTVPVLREAALRSLVATGPEGGGEGPEIRNSQANRAQEERPRDQVKRNPDI